MSKLTLTIKIPDWTCKLAVFAVLLYRRLRFGYPYRRIPLTKGKFAIVDPEDYHRLIKHKWHVTQGRTTFYAQRKIFNYKTGRQIAIKMHRQIMKYKLSATRSTLSATRYLSDEVLTKADKLSATRSTLSANLLVDHINRNGLDNRKANLRNATASQNTINRQKSRRKTRSKYKGLTWHKQKGQWFARISVNRRVIPLGYFDNETDAAIAYDRAAKKYHKQFAVLNFK